jgi:hypothetical protein
MLAGSAPTDFIVISLCALPLISKAQPVAPTDDERSSSATVQLLDSTAAS